MNLFSPLVNYRAIFAFVALIYKQRELTVEMTKREFSERYAGQLLGVIGRRPPLEDQAGWIVLDAQAADTTAQSALQQGLKLFFLGDGDRQEIDAHVST